MACAQCKSDECRVANAEEALDMATRARGRSYDYDMVVWAREFVTEAKQECSARAKQQQQQQGE